MLKHTSEPPACAVALHGHSPAHTCVAPYRRPQAPTRGVQAALAGVSFPCRRHWEALSSLGKAQLGLKRVGLHGEGRGLASRPAACWGWQSLRGSWVLGGAVASLAEVSRVLPLPCKLQVEAVAPQPNVPFSLSHIQPLHCWPGLQTRELSSGLAISLLCSGFK